MVSQTEGEDANVSGEVIVGEMKRVYADWTGGRQPRDGEMFNQGLYTNLFGVGPVEDYPFFDRVDDGLVARLKGSYNGETDDSTLSASLAYTINTDNLNIVPFVTGNFASDLADTYRVGLQLGINFGDLGDLKVIIESPTENPEDVQGKIELFSGGI